MMEKQGMQYMKLQEWTWFNVHCKTSQATENKNKQLAERGKKAAMINKFLCYLKIAAFAFQANNKSFIYSLIAVTSADMSSPADQALVPDQDQDDQDISMELVQGKFDLTTVGRLAKAKTPFWSNPKK